MGCYNEIIAIMESDKKKREYFEAQRAKIKGEYDKALDEKSLLLEATRILSTVSDNQLAQLIKVIEETINGVLSQIFSADDPRLVKIDKGLIRDKNPQLKATLYTKDMVARDIADQTGTGVKQIVSMVFSLVVVSVRNDRPIIILDECLSGLHNKAKQVMKNIIKLFARRGFQFILVEYGIDNLGVMYNVEKHGGTSSVIAINGKYDPNKKFMDEPEPDIDLDENYNEEEDL